MAVSCLIVLGPATASARDMNGKAGLGFSARLDSGFRQVPAMTIRYWKKSFAVEGIGGFDWDVVLGKTDTVKRFHGGVGVLYMIHSERHLSVTLGARAYIQSTDSETESAAVPVTVDKKGETDFPAALTDKPELKIRVLVALPLQIEHFLSDHSSVTASVALTMVPGRAFTQTAEDPAAASTSEPAGILFQLAGRYSGGLGYTYYF